MSLLNEVLDDMKKRDASPKRQRIVTRPENFHHHRSTAPKMPRDATNSEFDAMVAFNPYATPKESKLNVDMIKSYPPVRMLAFLFLCFALVGIGHLTLVKYRSVSMALFQSDPFYAGAFKAYHSIYSMFLPQKNMQELDQGIQSLEVTLPTQAQFQLNPTPRTSSRPMTSNNATLSLPAAPVNAAIADEDSNTSVALGSVLAQVVSKAQEAPATPSPRPQALPESPPQNNVALVSPQDFAARWNASLTEPETTVQPTAPAVRAEVQAPAAIEIPVQMPVEEKVPAPSDTFSRIWQKNMQPMPEPAKLASSDSQTSLAMLQEAMNQPVPVIKTPTQVFTESKEVQPDPVTRVQAPAAPVAQLPTLSPKISAEAAPPAPSMGQMIKSKRTAEVEVSAAIKKADSLKKLGGYQEAESILLHALKAYPMSKETRAALAALYVDIGHFSDAHQLLEVALSNEPDYLPFIRLMARAKAGMGEIDNAIALLLDRPPTLEDSPEHYSLLSALYQQQGRHDLAVNLYWELLELYPENGRWWAGLGISLEASKAHQSALDSYTRALTASGLEPNLRTFVNQRINELSRRDNIASNHAKVFK